MCDMLGGVEVYTDIYGYTDSTVVDIFNSYVRNTTQCGEKNVTHAEVRLDLRKHT